MIPRRDIHRKAQIAGAENAVLQLQWNVPRIAAEHRNWAATEAMPLAELQQIILDVIAGHEYVRAALRKFRDVTVPADLTILTVGAALRADIVEIGEVGTAVTDALDVFIAMPRTTYAEIIVACDYLISTITPPPSLWD